MEEGSDDHGTDVGRLSQIRITQRYMSARTLQCWLADPALEQFQHNVIGMARGFRRDGSRTLS